MRCGVFTIAKQASDEFEDAIPALMVPVSQHKDRSKILLARQFAFENPDCPLEIEQLHDRLGQHFRRHD